MVDIIAYIDTKVKECLEGRSYGLCRQLMDDNGEVYPATYEKRGTSYQKVTPDDKWPTTWYYRLMNSTIDNNDTYSFGRAGSLKANTTVRAVLISQIDAGEIALDQFIDAAADFMVPVKNIVNLPDYKYVEFGDSISVNRNRDTTWADEFGKAYADKYQARYNLFVIEFTVESIKCKVCECA